MQYSGRSTSRVFHAALRGAVLWCFVLSAARAGLQVETLVCAKENSVAMEAPVGPANTGVNVLAGDTVFITPNPLSSWTASSRGSEYVVNAGGFKPDNPWCSQCGGCKTRNVSLDGRTSIPKALRHSSLVYKLDNDPDPSKGVWMEVGTHTEFVATSGGNVYLGFWDTNSRDNDGCIEVRTTKMLPSDCNF